MKTNRIDIGSIRREQIVDAAVAVIAEQGLQNLSLSEIESKVGMSRGQLTYYFKAKEDILLAVFDRLLEMICRRQGGDPKRPPEEHPFARLTWLEVVARLLEMVLQKPPANPEFSSLQYTFLSQIGHRADFRERLAKLYEEWRNHGTEHLTRDLAERPSVRQISPRAIATLVQAVLHGLAMQSAVDPDAVDSREMAELCLDMLRTYLWGPTGAWSGDTRQEEGAGSGDPRPAQAHGLGDPRPAPAREPRRARAGKKRRLALKS